MAAVAVSKKNEGRMSSGGDQSQYPSIKAEISPKQKTTSEVSPKRKESTPKKNRYQNPTVVEQKEEEQEDQVHDDGHGDSFMVELSPVQQSYLMEMVEAPRPNMRYCYPLLYVSPCGTVSVIFRGDIFVEMTVDKTIRVLCPGKFSAACNASGTTSCIMHPKARIYQSDTHVYCELDDNKMAVFGSQGIVFTMKRMSHSFLVSSSTVKGTTPISSQFIKYPLMQTDFTMNLLYMQSECGYSNVARCNEIVRNAKYNMNDEGTLAVVINGMLIKQQANGELTVHNRPRLIRASPTDKTVYIHSHYVHMGVQKDGKAFVKRGDKRLHSSRSGLVVSDGDCTTSMDHVGHIISST